jgi:hypothetical protein
MKKQKNKSANKFDLEYFEDSTNFPNQIFLQDVFKYFENKNNQNTFELVEFLNLFKEQNDLLIENLSNPGKTFRNLKDLPVSGLDLHVLYFFILEFYGGYPLKEYQYYEYAESELNAANEEFARNYNSLLKLIETEFLSYPEDTTEKNTYLVKADDGFSISPKQSDTKAKQEIPKRIGAKFYALYHWILIEIGKESPFEKNNFDKNNMAFIKNFGINRYKCSGQGFYRAFKDFDITKKNLIVREFGKDYKKIIITISNNDSNVINHLKKYPN